MAGWISTIFEGFLLGKFLNFIEHICYAGSAILISRLVLAGILEKGRAAMNPAGVVDFIAFPAILTALVILSRGWKRALEPDAKLLLTCLLVLSLFHHLSNALERGGITKELDSFEDCIEIMMLYIFTSLRESWCAKLCRLLEILS